jgi:hypothetical protein
MKILMLHGINHDMFCLTAPSVMRRREWLGQPPEAPATA